jgi:tRNA dimethylallyltransferase
MKKVLVIAGLTASGKSSLSLDWAQKLKGEIINADSQQVYQGLDIGTAKVSLLEQQQVAHHLLDILKVEEHFNVKRFQELSRQKIEEITARGHLPILVGGTGLYLKAALYDYIFEEETTQDQFEDESTEDLVKKLHEIDPKALESIHPNNRKRIIRALNMAKTSLKSVRIDAQSHQALYDVFWLVLSPPKSVVDYRIQERVDKMFEAGLVEEVTHFFKEDRTQSYQSFQAIGYKEFKDYFNQEASLEEVKEKIVVRTRQFAKKQMTWFRHQLPSRFVNSLDAEEMQKAYEDVIKWLEVKL